MKDIQIGLIGTGRMGKAHAERSWNYVTLGYGHSEIWWRDFVVQLQQNGYDEVLSIEHEDFSLPPLWVYVNPLNA